MGLFISEKTNSVTPAQIPGMGCCRVNAVGALQIEGDVSTEIPETLSFPTLVVPSDQIAPFMCSAVQ